MSDKTLQRYSQKLNVSDKQVTHECSSQRSSEIPFHNTNADITVKCESLELKGVFDMDVNCEENLAMNFNAENKMCNQIFLKSEIKEELMDDDSLLPVHYVDDGEFSCEDSKIDTSDTKVGLYIDKNCKEINIETFNSANENNEQKSLKSEIKKEPVDDDSSILSPENVDDASTMITHNDDKPYQCDVCKKCFTASSNLKKHNRVHTGEKPYQCNVCKKCFADSSQLKQHSRIHTGEKPYRCNVCKKCFASSSDLKKHNRIHTGEKPCQCLVCKKCFTTTSDLKKHNRVHTGEKPYQCDVCKKCFADSSQSKQHSRVHTGEKPYQCDICKKCFSSSSYLKVHSRLHTGDKPF